MILDSKKMKVFVLWQVGSWVLFAQKAAVLCQVMRTKKLNYDVMMTSQSPFRHSLQGGNQSCQV